MAVRNHLRRFRFEAGGMTQQDLAVRAGVTRQSIIAIERGKYRPTIELALRLAAVFAVPVEALFELADDGDGGDGGDDGGKAAGRHGTIMPADPSPGTRSAP